jgi:hypothetical protein
MQHLTLVVAALALTGCPGPGEGGSSLIGTWDELPAPTSNDPPGSATFRADGTFDIVDDEPRTGTFVESDGVLIVTSDTGEIEELPYAVDGDLFTPIGLRHVGGGVGFAGEWRADGTNNGQPTSMQLVLASDNTFQLTVGDTDSFSGIWRDNGGDLITTLQMPDSNGHTLSVDLPWHSIDDAVSLLAYERR